MVSRAQGTDQSCKVKAVHKQGLGPTSRRRFYEKPNPTRPGLRAIPAGRCSQAEGPQTYDRCERGSTQRLAHWPEIILMGILLGGGV